MIGKENESYEKKNRKGMSCYAQNEILKQEQDKICVFYSKGDKDTLFVSPFADPISEVIEPGIHVGNATPKVLS